jgi:hypothetical protein
LANAEQVAAVPNCIAEWGRGDMGMTLGMSDAHDPPYPPEMRRASAGARGVQGQRARAFLEMVTPDNVVQ